MKPEKQRIAIAESMGAVWLDVPPKDGYLYRPTRLLTFHKWEFDSGRCAPLPLPDKNGDAVCIPNYPDDLNAMNEAEKMMTWEQKEYYSMILFKMTMDNADPLSFRSTHATASQRAEAFLRTIGKWEDDA